MLCVIFDVYLLVTYLPKLPLFGDALSWWLVDPQHLYERALRSLIEWGAFRYSPVIGQAMSPLASLPWLVFLWVFTTIQLSLVVLMGRSRWWLVLIFPGTLLELAAGNIHLILAAVIYLGFRYPALWAIPILTKITPGIGLLWFAARHEWRQLGIAISVTVIIAGLSALVTPTAWRAWIDALAQMSQLPNPSAWPPLAARLPFALVFVWMSARPTREWLLPVGVLLALPTIYPSSFGLLAASVALYTRPTATPTSKVGQGSEPRAALPTLRRESTG
jgi:Glycosyltransferase family 87